MRTLVAAFVMLLVHSAQAEAQPQRSAQQAAQIQSGWLTPMVEFPAGFNRAATRANIEERAVEVDCRDRGTRVLTCRWQIGAHLVVNGAAREDRRSLEDVQVFLEASAGQAGALSLLSAFTVLTHYFEPQAAPGERSAALSALFPRTTGGPLMNEVKLGSTRFMVRTMPGVRMTLTAKRDA